MLLTSPRRSIPGWTFDKRRDPSFLFLPDPHEYQLKGSRLWSPSGTFLEVRYVDLTYYNDDHRYRGQYVHHTTHLIDDGDAGIWKKIHHEFLGYVEAYCEFKETWRFKPRMREVPIYHHEYGYGVTPDGEGLILDGDPAIVELKTGNMPWWTAIQTAAQDLAVASWDSKETFRRRIGVELKKNGKFRVKEFTSTIDDDDYTWKSNLQTVRRHHREPRPKLTAALAY